MIEVSELTKRYGNTLAVDRLTFTVQPGQVTGFLGPNGAGKSTTMRMILGLDIPTGGWATIDRKPLADHARPLRVVGALLEARAIHPGRTARNHLRSLAETHGISRARVDEVIDLAGLDRVADRRVRSFSLGMGQRLGVASALLGDPQTLILDEPVNGLDPDGVRWIRQLLRRLADEGRTIFLSSHLMSEMAVTADHIVVVGRGRLLRDMPMRDLIAESSRRTVRVRTPLAERLSDELRRPGVTIRVGADGESLEVEGLTTDDIGWAASRSAIPILELTDVQGSLEDAYMTLTSDDVEYRGSQDPDTRGEPGAAA